MPEGDTIFRTATTLRKALAGKSITRFETNENLLLPLDRRSSIVHRQIHAVEPRGKHLLMILRDESAESPAINAPERLGLDLIRSDLILHTHLRMTGSWHVYRPGERWWKSPRLARLSIHTEDFVAVCFNAPVVELLTAREAVRHPSLVNLGPDAITPEFDSDEARRRILRNPDLEIGVAIMNQRAMSGVGNVYKSEVLFIRRISPFRKVRDLSDEELDGLIAESHRLLLLNATGGVRRTMFDLHRDRHLWAYGRAGRPCRVCGEGIRTWKQGNDARTTYYCSRCQV